MKWIGQHIWDYISRFRNDVYLEDISTGTIASGGNLGLDANNKIVKADTEAGELSFNGSTANGLLTYGDASTIDVESTLTYNGGTGIMLLESSISTTPQIFISNTNTDATSGKLVFQKSAAGSDNDDVGVIAFNSQDDGGGAESFAQIVGEIADASNNDEAGKVRIGILTDGSALQDAFIATGLGTGERVDINLGHGSTSTTTIAGNLDIDGDTITSAGALNLQSTGNIVLDPVSQQVQCDAFGFTVSSSTAGPIISCINNVNDSNGAYLYLMNNRDGNGSEDDDLLGLIGFSGDDASGNAETYAQIKGSIIESQHGSETGRLRFKVAEYDGTLTDGLLLEGQDQNGEIDVTIGAGAASTTTIAGTLTMGSTAFANNSGVIQVATQGTIDHDSLANFVANEHIDWTGDVSASSVIHTNNITDLHGAGVNGSANQLLTDDGDGTVTSESNFTYTGTALTVQAVTSTFSHRTSSNLIVTNTGDNDAGGILLLKNERNSGSTANSDGDILGMIQFDGHNDAGTPADRTYALIKATAPDVSSGAEEGQLSLQVSSHDGELQPGVKLFSGDAEDEVDVTIGNGATSLTTIAGDLDIDGDKITTAGNIEIETGGGGNITLDSQGDITLEVSNSFTADSPSYTFTHGGGERPSFLIQNTADDATGPNVIISNIRDGNGLNDGDSLGVINFSGEDAAGGSEGYAAIQGVANETAHGDECGTLNFYVANNGTLKEGVIIEANSSTTSEVNVQIANGAASNTTIAGNAVLGGNIELGHASDTTLARSAAGTVTIEGNEIITTATTEGVVRNYTTTIDQATMNALHTTAVTLIAAPGSGKQVLPLDCWLRVTRNTTQLNNVALSLSWNSDTSLAGAAFYQKGFMRNKTTDEFIRLVRYTNYLGNFATDNRTLTLKLTGAITTNSVTSTKVHLQYIIIDV